MALSFVAASTATRDRGVVITVPKPAGVVAGDLMVAAIHRAPGDVLTAPAGWTLIATDSSNYTSTYYKVAGASEPVDYEWANSSGVDQAAAIVAYRGAHGTPVEVSATAIGTSTSVTAPSVTASATGRVLLYVGGIKFPSNAVGTPAGMTSRAVADQNGAGSGAHLRVAELALGASTGATGSKTGTATTSDAWGAQSLLLAPANTAPTAPTLTAPNGGETINTTATVSSTAATDPEFDTVVYDYDLTTNNGSSWTRIITSGSTSQTYDFSAVAASTTCRVRVRARDTGGLTSAWDESNGNFTVQHNVAPTAPTLLTPVGGAIVDKDVAQTLDWASNDPDTGDYQSAYELRHRVVGAPSWTTTGKVTSTTSARTFTAGFFTAGDYEWQVLTYDAAGLVSPWSASGFFTAGSTPGMPTILTPGSGATIGSADYAVSWSSPDQDAYQVRRVADAAGVPDTATVYSDSGTVVSTTTRDHAVTFGTNNRYEHVQVRIQNDALWSSWASHRVLISYTPPAAPTVALVTDDATASIDVAITNPEPGAGQPAVTSHDVYRRESAVGGDGIRVAAGLLPGASWTDWTPASGLDYGYLAVAHGDNSTSSSSAWTTTATPAVPPPPAPVDIYGGY